MSQAFSSFAVRGARAGRLAWVLALASCAPAPVVQEARAQFARHEYCPTSRIESARDIVDVPPPPAAIARDPDRLKLWDAEAQRRAAASSSHRVVVSGCGVQVEYVCWDLWDDAEPLPGDTRITKRAGCHENRRSAATF